MRIDAADTGCLLTRKPFERKQKPSFYEEYIKKCTCE